MLYIIIKKHLLHEHFIGALEGSEGIHVIRYPFLKHGRLKSVARSIEAYILWWLPYSWCYPAEFLAELRKIRLTDSVLYFTIENRKTLQILRKFVCARKQSLWIWDPVRSFRKSVFARWSYKVWLRSSGLGAYTFDPRDARELNIKLIEQVFRYPTDETINQTEKDIDLYFTGTDKGRLAEVKRWKYHFEQYNFRTHFHIIADSGKFYSEQDAALLSDTWIPYLSNLNFVRRSKCLLELLQSTQSGPTMRSIEALFYGCKLITNNTSIVDCGFYDKTRIFIIGSDRLDELQAFLRLPIEAPSKELLAKHEMRTWLLQFDSGLALGNRIP